MRRILGLLLGVALLAGCSSPQYGIDNNLVDDWPAPPVPESFRPADTGCFDDLVTNAPLAEYAPFDCAERHVAEAYFVGDLTGDDAAAAVREAATECGRRAAVFLGADWRTGRIRLQPVLPASPAWDAGARWFRCDAAEVDLATDRVASRTGSLRDALKEPGPLTLGCVNPTVRGERVTAMTAVDCAKRHTAEFAGLWTAPETDFAKLTSGDAMAAGCRSAIADFAALPDDSDVRFRVGWLGFAPTRPQWDQGVRTVQCFLWVQDRPMTGSYRGAGPGKLPINYG